MKKKIIIFFIALFSHNLIFPFYNENSLNPLEFKELTQQENDALLQELYDLQNYGQDILVSPTTPLLYEFLIKPINAFIDNNNLEISPDCSLIQKSTKEFPNRSVCFTATGSTHITIGIHLLITLLELSLFQGIAFWIAHEIGHLLQNHNNKLIYSDARLETINKEIDADRFACKATLRNEHDKIMSIQALYTMMVMNAIYKLFSNRINTPNHSINTLIRTISYRIMTKSPQTYWNAIQNHDAIDEILKHTLVNITADNKKKIIKLHDFTEKFMYQLIKNTNNQTLINDINTKTIGSLSHPSPKERVAMIKATAITQ